MADYTNVNRAAPLRNVAAFSTLLTKMVERDGELPGLACFYGPSGWGKTKSAVYGANRYRATYVECGQFTTARSLLENILIERGNRSPRGSIEQMKTKAVEMIAAEPHRPLIVDEAHWIAQKRFVDLLREISDKSGGCITACSNGSRPSPATRRISRCSPRRAARTSPSRRTSPQPSCSAPRATPGASSSIWKRRPASRSSPA